MTEEISQLNVDLCYEVTACSHQEEELTRLREELGKKSSEMLEKDSELQQRGFVLLATQQTLEEMRQRVEWAEATLRSKRDTFEEMMEYLKDDLSRVQIAHDEAEAKVHKQEAIADCQHALKVFKFKTYTEGYEEGKRGEPLKYSLDIGSSPNGGSQDPLGGRARVGGPIKPSI